MCLTCLPGKCRNNLLLLLFPMCIISLLYKKWLPLLSDWACLTRHSSPLTDTLHGLMSAPCANGSVSQLFPQYSPNLIHKEAQVTLWRFSCLYYSTSYLMPNFTVVMPNPLRWALLSFHWLSFWTYASYACPWSLQQSGYVHKLSLFLNTWPKNSL